MEQLNAAQAMLGACKLSALLTPAIKEFRLVSLCRPMARPPPITCTRQPRRAPFTGRLLRRAYARKMEIEVRAEIFISILRESHLPFSKNDYNSNRPHTSLCVPNVWPAPDLQVDFYDLVSISLQ
jgi:hypothetical protein